MVNDSPSMFRDYTIPLWFLKLGALVNVCLLCKTAAVGGDSFVVVPALIFLAVCGYRCLFPVRYERDVVFHDSVWSSVFATRLLATFAEVAFMGLQATVIERLNVGHVGWVTAVAVYMVAQIVVSQGFVWLAILGEQFELYFYEELGWVFAVGSQLLASVYLWLTIDTLAGEMILLRLNMLFAAIYLPFQVFNLRAIKIQARRERKSKTSWTWARLDAGIRRSIEIKNRRTDAHSWGGIVGLMWMTGYFATLLPVWVYCIVATFAEH